MSLFQNLHRGDVRHFIRLSYRPEKDSVGSPGNRFCLLLQTPNSFLPPLIGEATFVCPKADCLSGSLDVTCHPRAAIARTTTVSRSAMRVLALPMQPCTAAAQITSRKQLCPELSVHNLSSIALVVPEGWAICGTCSTKRYSLGSSQCFSWAHGRVDLAWCRSAAPSKSF